MRIRSYESDSRKAWDDFVLGQPDATLFHSTPWKRAVEREFGYQPRYLFAEEDGRIRGVLPLFLISNWVQGSALISTPFAVYGGICAEAETAEAMLRQAACAMARDGAVKYLELRSLRPSASPGFIVKDLYVGFDCALHRDPEVVFRSLPKDTRYMVRKGQKSGLRLVVDSAQVETFYEIYAQNVRRLGTPVFSRRYFDILLEEFGSSAEVGVVWRGNKAVAAVFSFRFRDALLPHFGGSIPEGREWGANNFLYWELIRNACEQGLQRYDFGRSKAGTGAYFFKTQWNMRQTPLPYEYYLVKRRTLPNFSPVNPRLKLAITIWKHVPLPLTKALGPSLVRLFP